MMSISDFLVLFFILFVEYQVCAILITSSILHINVGRLSAVTTSCVSSAYDITWHLLWKTDGRSFVKVRNSNGPIIEPWGTPDLTSDDVETNFSNFVFWCLFVRYDLIHLRVDPDNLSFCSLLRRRSWLIESNALLRSRLTIAQHFFWSTILCTWFNSSARQVVVPCPFR